MQWEPRTPPSHRARLIVVAIATIPIILVVVGTLVLLWQVLGQATATAP